MSTADDYLDYCKIVSSDEPTWIIAKRSDVGNGAKPTLLFFGLHAYASASVFNVKVSHRETERYGIVALHTCEDTEANRKLIACARLRLHVYK
jgi:hypothetical protein